MLDHISNTIKLLEKKLDRQITAMNETQDTINALKELDSMKQEELELAGAKKGTRKVP